MPKGPLNIFPTMKDMKMISVWICLLVFSAMQCTLADSTMPPDFGMFEDDITPTDDPLNDPNELMGPEMTMSDDVNYMSKYGYMNETESKTNITKHEQMVSAIKKFQGDVGLNQTGQMDPETKKMMRMPRCGMKYIEVEKHNRMKRYVLRGTRWRSTSLTYKFVSSTRQLSQTQIDLIMQRALKFWSDVSPLKFSKRTSRQRADIELRFAVGSHGDGSRFDGRGKTLAHAFYPGVAKISGDAHFDNDEKWTHKTYSGTNLLQVATHEFGHSLGLRHSSTKSAVMAPIYRGYQPNFKLHSDDIAGIRAIYGQGSPGTPSMPSGGCQGGFDAVISARARNGRTITLAFKGEYYYTLGTGGRIRISDKFRNLKSVDAAIARPNSNSNGINVYMFAGSRLIYYTMRLYSRNRNTALYRGIFSISRVVRGLPSNIDAIFKWSGNGRLYVFKGSLYYRIRGNRVDRGYPRSISVWNLPSNVRKVDAGFTYSNKRTYFFVGSNYYRYQARRLRIDRGYPRNIGKWWRQCKAGANLEDEPPTESTDDEMMSASDGFENFNPVLGDGKTGGATGTAPGAMSVLLTFYIGIMMLLRAE